MNLVCPQCGERTMQPVEVGGIDKMFSCLFCGFQTVVSLCASLDGVVSVNCDGIPEVKVSVTPGLGAFALAFGDDVQIGQIDIPWDDTLESEFKEIFSSGELESGFVTRWNSTTKSVEVAFSIGEPMLEGIALLSDTQLLCA